MDAEIHCICGEVEAIAPEHLPREHPCRGCGRTLEFFTPGRGADDVRWLLLFDDDGAPRCAVPIPIGVPLALGSADNSWLRLTGPEVRPAHAQLSLTADRRLSVRHVGGPAATWINRARIIEGVLKDGDLLRLGGHQLTAAAHRAALTAARAAGGAVVVEDEEGESESAVELYPVAPAAAPPAGAVRRRALWIGVTAAAFLGATFSVARTTILPRLNSPMPTETEYRCPADGTTFRAAWASKPPACPQCGSPCFGLMKYRRMLIGDGPTTAPTTNEAQADAAAAGGRP